jgi:hypothetical protein
MNRIASPQDLQAELQRLLTYSQNPKPSREKLASAIRDLADRVAGAKQAASSAERTAAEPGVYTRLAVKSPGDVLKVINKVRSSFKPSPKPPLEEKDLRPILNKVEDLEKALDKTFGSDFHLTVMGHGTKLL